MQIRNNSQNFSRSNNYLKDQENTNQKQNIQANSNQSKDSQKIVELLLKNISSKSGNSKNNQSAIESALAQILPKSISNTFFNQSISSSKARNSLNQAAKDSSNPLTQVRDLLTNIVKNNVADSATAAKYNRAINNTILAFKNSSAGNLLSAIRNNLQSIGIDSGVAKDLVKTVQNWKQLNNEQKISAASNLGFKVLENLKVLTPENASDYRGVTSAISVLANSNSSTSDKIIAVSSALAGLGTTSFSGSLDLPTQIGKIDVVGSASAQDGSPGYLLADGTIVARSELLTSQNAYSAIQALAIIAGNSDTRNKIISLTQLGIQSGTANGIISQANAGNLGAALSALSTISNWSQMNTEQRFMATTQTAASVFDALSSYGANAAGTATGAAGSSVTGTFLSGAGAIAGIFTGANQAVDVIDAMGDMAQSQAVKVGAIGLGSAGAAIGAGISVLSGIYAASTAVVATAGATAAGAAATGATIGSAIPVAGTIIGAVIGAAIGVVLGFASSGKGKGQMMRDSWRKAMEQAGIAQKIDGSHHFTLADGSLYNVGRDGNAKLKNLDGTERKTTDLDSGNPLANESIPYGHVFAIATGLDPSNTAHSFFDSAVVQSINAATSNTNTMDGMKANYRAMLQKGNVDPRNLAMRLEVLRASNKITDQEYVMYLGVTNNIFQTNFQPASREKAHNFLVSQLSANPNLADGEKQLLEILTNQEKYAKSLAELQKRLDKYAPKS